MLQRSIAKCDQIMFRRANMLLLDLHYEGILNHKVTSALSKVIDHSYAQRYTYIQNFEEFVESPF